MKYLSQNNNPKRRNRWFYMRYLITILVVITGLYACSNYSNHTAGLKKLPENATIIAFGDSLTYGSGARRHQSYPDALSELIGLQVDNHGVPGEISRHGLDRLEELLSQSQQDLVIICHAGNDMLRNIPTAASKQNLIDMIKLVRASGSDVILLGVPEPSFFRLKTAEFYLQVAKEMNVPLEAGIIAQVESDRSLKSDRIHPNTAGYRKIAQSIKTLLEVNGAL